MILITGKGVPDLSTRSLVHKLASKLQIPVLGLFDWNPFGVAIWKTYRQGSIGMGTESYMFSIGNLSSKHYSSSNQ